MRGNTGRRRGSKVTPSSWLCPNGLSHFVSVGQSTIRDKRRIQAGGSHHCLRWVRTPGGEQRGLRNLGLLGGSLAA
jgi:hypothetical protein